MDTLSAYARAQAARGNRVMVFDWERAASLIAASGTSDASAGLQSDWGMTGGRIFADGKPVPAEDTYVYLASTWAPPELDINGDVQECWIYRDDWDAHTYWPDSALAILNH